MPPVVNVSPIRLFDVKLNIKSGATDVGDFEKHISSVVMTPTTGSVQWSGLGKNVHSFPTGTAWAIALAYAQDWASATSLARYLWENRGKVVTLLFLPDNSKAISTTNPGWRVDVTLQPGPIGGAVDTVATAEVTLQAVSEPALVTS